MKKADFNDIYGCFGIRPVLRNGSYSINRAEANRVRRAIQIYLMHHKPRRSTLALELRPIIAKYAGQLRRQSLQIGTLKALTNAGYTGQESYGILRELFHLTNRAALHPEAITLRASFVDRVT